MNEDPSWIPPGIDTSKANTARVYDWWLGGEHNFRVDQDAARTLIAVAPNVRAIARANRAFLGRAVRCLADAGIRQFLDIGSGIPTARNVHQITEEIAPGSHVVYVDKDDVAVAHSKLILDGNPDATVIHADLRDPEAILAHPETRRVIDFTRPVGLLLVSVLHFVPDGDNPAGIITRLRDALAPGSFLVLTHGCRDAYPELGDTFNSVYNDRVDATSTSRTRDEITGFFDGFTLVEPGLVWTPEWRPDSPEDVPEDPSSYGMVAGVGVKER